MPNVASPIIIQVSLSLGFALLVEAGLSYLGHGRATADPQLGCHAERGLPVHLHDAVGPRLPGSGHHALVLSFNLVADGLRDSLGRERPTSSSLVSTDAEKRPSRCRLRGTPRSDRQTAAPWRGPAPASPPHRGSPAAAEPAPLLAVKGLRIEFLTNGEWFPVMEDANFTVERGRTLGLVGESGSGKTVSALAIMGLLPPRGCRASGSARFEGRDLHASVPGRFRQIRGNEIAMIFQEPMTSLNPAYTVGNQIAEQVRTHRHLSKAESWKVAVEMLERVEIPDAATRARDYPHAFSGGHAPAGDDRHGTVLLAQAADRRRAHHRPRRDHPGPDRRAPPHLAARRRTWR